MWLVAKALSVVSKTTDTEKKCKGKYSTFFILQNTTHYAV